MTKHQSGIRAFIAFGPLCALCVVLSACGEAQETAEESAQVEAASSDTPAVSETSSPTPSAPADAPLPEFDVGKTVAPPAAPPTLAIAPLAGASDRRLDYSALLQECFRHVVGAACEASGGGTVASLEVVDAAFAKRNLAAEQSAPEETLLDIARELDVSLLLSWEPFQDSDGRPQLRLRLVSTDAGTIVFEKKIASPNKTGLPISYLDMFIAAWPAAAEACLEQQSPSAKLLAEDHATTPTRQLASSMGRLVFGDRIARRRNDIVEKPGDAEGWACLSRDYSRLAAALDSRSKFKRQLAARSLAAALAGRELSPLNPKVLQALGCAYWTNRLNGRALAALLTAKQDSELDDAASSLLSWLTGESEALEEEATARLSSFAGRLRASQMRDFWMDYEAFELLGATSVDRWSVDSPLLAASLDRKESPEASVAKAVFRSSLMAFRAGALCANESGMDLAPYLKRLQGIDTELCEFAAMDWGGAPAPPASEIEERLVSGFSLTEFLAGKGAPAMLMKLAGDVGDLTDGPFPISSSLLNWTGADRLAFARAQCADAWLGAWRAAKFERKDETLAVQALSLAEEMFPDSSAILTAKAHFFYATGLDAAKRSKAIAAALAIDPAYAPAATLSIETRRARESIDESTRLLESLRSCDPFNADLSCYIASNLTHLGNLPRARGVYEAARAIDPKNPKPYLGQLEIFSRQETRTVTVEMVSEMLSAFPNTPALRLEAARLYFENSEPERGASLAASLAQQHGSRFGPASLAARINAYLGRKAEMVEILESFLESDPSSAKAATLLGRLLLTRGDYAEAEKAYAAAAKISPDSVSTWIGWAEAARGSGRDDEAVDLLKKAADLGAPGPAAMAAGRILIERGERDQALAMAKQTQKSHDRAVGGYEIEARVKIAQGDAEAAASIIAEFVSGNPRNPYGLLAQSRILKTLERFEEVAQAAQAGLDLCNESAELLLRRAKIEALREADKLGDCADDMRIVKKIGFNDPDCLTALASVELQRDDPLRARSLLSVALRIAPKHSRALSWRAMVELEQGGKAKAAQWADEARDAMVGIDTETLSNCATVWKKSGHHAKAVEAYQLILTVESAGYAADAARQVVGKL